MAGSVLPRSKPGRVAEPEHSRVTKQHRQSKRELNNRVRDAAEAEQFEHAIALAQAHPDANEHTAVSLLAGSPSIAQVKRCELLMSQRSLLHGRGATAFSVVASAFASAFCNSSSADGCARILARLRQQCVHLHRVGLSEGAYAAPLSTLAHDATLQPKSGRLFTWHRRSRLVKLLLRMAILDECASASLFSLAFQATECRPSQWESLCTLLNRAKPAADAQLLTLCVRAASLAGDDTAASQMCQSGTADVHVCNAYMATLARRRKAHAAHSLWRSMTRFERDHYTVSAALSAAAKCANAELGEDVLQWLIDRGLTIEHNEHTATAAVAYMGSVGAWQRAILLVDRFVQERGMREPVCSAGVKALVQSGQLQHALTLLRHMQKHGVLPSRRTFDALVPALEMNQQHEVAADLRQLQSSLSTLHEL